MRRLTVWLPLACLALALALAISGCGEQTQLTARERAVLTGLSRLPAAPARPSNRLADDPQAIEFGRTLFYDKRLSGDGTVSCATCHDPAKGWSDGKRFSEGLATTARHSPTLWNVAHNRWFFWDGRADSLWAQCRGPLEAPGEMGTTRTRLARLLTEDAKLAASLAELIGELPTFDRPLPVDARPKRDDEPNDHDYVTAWNDMSAADRDRVDDLMAGACKAIAAFERTIISSDAAIDRYVAGDLAALTAIEKRGYRLFTGRGNCILCHHGPNLTDGEFHNIGLDTETGKSVDLGRFRGVEQVLDDDWNGLGERSDDRSETANIKLRYLLPQPNNLGEMKTPTLRNVTETAPYMHDGRFATLEEVLRFYSRLNETAAIGHREESLVPLRLTDDETAELIAFLGALTGPPPGPELLDPNN